MRDVTMDRRDSAFDESLLSGYLDGELSQGEAQRVRLYIEDHPEARRLLDEMRGLRDAALTTRLAVPSDDQWDERPRSGSSRFFRGSAWVLLGLWLIATASLGAWAWWTSTAAWWAKALSATVVAAPGLLFLSILLDRLKLRPADRYRRILK